MDTELKETTIMVVDDVLVNLKILQNMLQTRGYRVLMFQDGRKALNAATENPPDLILLDIMMPDMDGFEVCSHLKAEDTLKDIPVLFISTLNETTDKVKAFSEGGVDYVSKPFQEEEVHARVETHLRLRKMQLELNNYNQYLEELVQEKVREISESQHSTIVALANLAEHRDEDTGAHIKRTQQFCRILAEHLRTHTDYKESIDDAFMENIYHAAPLHDIGKVGISDNILLKPGKLTAEEFEIIKTHTLIGANTLQGVQDDYPNNAFINMGVDIARFHHEKWDGSGYPDGLKGEDIPLCGRIMALVDVYDALRSKRPYKPAFSHEKSKAIIMEGAGQQFDPRLVEAFKFLEAEFARIRDQTDVCVNNIEHKTYNSSVHP
ncbi:MAG: HD-GYP domain-containing protein [Thermodesulfobacteriota bacterium]